MRKLGALLLSSTILSAFVLFVSSCDDEPAVPPKLSFAVSTLTAKESDDNLFVEVTLDKPASQTITIDYSLSGTAKDQVAATATSSPADYKVVGEHGEVEIAKGETTGKIELDFNSDTDLEDDETIEISIEEVSLEGIEITRDDEVNITLKQEDGLLIALQWGIGAGESYPDVDMDLFLWLENTSSVLGLTNYRGIKGSTYTNWVGGSTPEFLFIPTVAFDDESFGLSCTYYAGTKTPMNFVVTYREIVNDNIATTTVRNGTYTLANINKWDAETATDPLLVAKFKKVGTDFTDFEEITIPVASSRLGNTVDLKNVIKRQSTSIEKSEHVKQILNMLNSN